MERGDWLKALVEAVHHFASRAYQEKNWFLGNTGVEWADEVFLRLDDLAFDLFFEKYSHDFTAEQHAAWQAFTNAVASYETKLPRFPDAQVIIDDPEWQRVREVAARFVASFK